MPSTTATPADEAAAEFAERDLTAEAARIFAEDLEPTDPPTDEETEAPPEASRRRRGRTKEIAIAPEPEPIPEDIWLPNGKDRTGQRLLHRKLAEVMFTVERIPKNGIAPPAMGGFPFVQVGDAAKAIREQLAMKHVTLMPVEVQLIRATEHETGRGGVTTTETYHVTWEFVDGETGEVHRIQSVGTGADRGDKASPKAQTNAMKYALLMAFLLPTGDDPELEDSSDRHQQRQRSPRGQQEPTTPVVEAPDETGPVQVGGRQENASQAQLLEIGRFARKLKLGPTGLAAIIDQVLPAAKVPDFPANSDNKQKTDHIGNHLRSLKHEQVAEVIQVLMNSTTPSDEEAAL